MGTCGQAGIDAWLSTPGGSYESPSRSLPFVVYNLERALSSLHQSHARCANKNTATTACRVNERGEEEAEPPLYSEADLQACLDKIEVIDFQQVGRWVGRRALGGKDGLIGWVIDKIEVIDFQQVGG